MNKCKPDGTCSAKTMLDAVNCPHNTHFSVLHWCAMEDGGECLNNVARGQAGAVDYTNGHGHHDDYTSDFDDDGFPSSWTEDCEDC